MCMRSEAWATVFALPIVEVPTADNYVRQGVTTLITGPDGFSPVPLGLRST